MAQTTSGIRELKARLGPYLQRVKAAATLVITDWGKPVGRIAPIKPSVEAQTQELIRAGMIAWSGRKLTPTSPVAKSRGGQTVADLVLENRE